VLNPSVTKGNDMFIGSHFVSAKLWRGKSAAQLYTTEVQAVKFTSVLRDDHTLTVAAPCTHTHHLRLVLSIRKWTYTNFNERQLGVLEYAEGNFEEECSI
jgi:hypothetical protein